MTNFTPREIVSELDRYIVGQREAKRAVAVALRNRWRRQQVAPVTVRVAAAGSFGLRHGNLLSVRHRMIPAADGIVTRGTTATPATREPQIRCHGKQFCAAQIPVFCRLIGVCPLVPCRRSLRCAGALLAPLPVEAQVVRVLMRESTAASHGSLSVQLGRDVG